MFQNVTQIVKKVILLMIPNAEEWRYLEVKKLSVSLRGITSKYHRGFYCLNCLHSFRREYKVKSHKKVGKNIHFCNIIMVSEDTKILKLNQNHKSHKAPFTI